jgi:hypothetical protein
MHNRYELIPAPKTDDEMQILPDSTKYQHPVSTQFTLRRMACFGSPKFDRREPLHILSADSRFPDIEPRKIRKVGNHFLALFPVEDERAYIWKRNKDVKLRRHALIRGGTNDGVQGEENKMKSGESEMRMEENHNPKIVGRWDGGKGSWSI